MAAGSVQRLAKMMPLQPVVSRTMTTAPAAQRTAARRALPRLFPKAASSTAIAAHTALRRTKGFPLEASAGPLGSSGWFETGTSGSSDGSWDSSGLGTSSAEGESVDSCGISEVSDGCGTTSGTGVTTGSNGSVTSGGRESGRSESSSLSPESGRVLVYTMEYRENRLAEMVRAVPSVLRVKYSPHWFSAAVIDHHQ